MHLVEEIFMAMSQLLTRLLNFSASVARALMGGHPESSLIRAAFGFLALAIALLAAGMYSHWSVMVSAAVPGTLFIVLMSATYSGTKSFFTVMGIGTASMFMILWLFAMDNIHYVVLAVSMLFLTAMIAYMDGPMVSCMIRGTLAEMRVRSALKRIAGKKGHLLSNVVLQNDIGSCEIDYVVVNHAGVFVVDSRGLSGRVFNQGESAPWLQVLPSNQTIEFESPALENARQVRAMESLLGSDVPVHGVVVFTNAKFANEMPPNVVHVFELKGYIRQFKSKALVSSGQMHVVNTIEKKRDTSRAGRRALQQRMEERRLREHMG